MWKIRKKRNGSPIDTKEVPVMRDLPKPSPEAMKKILKLELEVPASLEVAGTLTLMFDKTLQKTHLVAPIQDPVLCLLLLQVLTNTLTGVAVQTLMRQQRKPSDSVLWTPPGMA